MHASVSRPSIKPHLYTSKRAMAFDVPECATNKRAWRQRQPKCSIKARRPWRGRAPKLLAPRKRLRCARARRLSGEIRPMRATLPMTPPSGGGQAMRMTKTPVWACKRSARPKAFAGRAPPRPERASAHIVSTPRSSAHFCLDVLPCDGRLMHGACATSAHEGVSNETPPTTT